MRVTLSDVAKQAGVGLSTASRALNRSGYVSEQLRKRVLQAAIALDYHPDMLAQQLASDRRRTITLFEVGNSGNVQSSQDLEWSFGPLYRALGMDIGEAGYELNIALQRSDEEHPAQVLARIRRSHGSAAIVLFIRSPLDARLIDELTLIDVPAVSINCPLEKLGIPVIHSDIRGAAFKATQHLIDGGYTCIAHIQGPTSLPATELRISGYEEAMAAAKMTPLMIEGGFDPDTGYSAMHKLLDINNKPNAVFCANDLVAIGASRAIQERELSVPHDIALVGFDDIPVSRFLFPSLSTVRQPQTRMGKATARAILDRLAGQTPPEKLLIHCELIVRESSVPRPTDHP